MNWLKKMAKLVKQPSITQTLIVLGILLASTGTLWTPDLFAALTSFLYPSDKNILFTRSIEPADYYLGTSDTITVTMSITNSESIDLRGFYFSDHSMNLQEV